MTKLEQTIKKWILSLDDVDIGVPEEKEIFDETVKKIIKKIRQDLIKEIRSDPEVAINKYKLFNN